MSEVADNADSSPQANELRGEVDIHLEGERFVLRPSHEAIRAIEAETGKTLVQLWSASDEAALSNEHCAIIVGEMVRAWGRATDHDVAKRVNNRRLGTLIYEHGILAVLPRISIVLMMAATGGCRASGEPKAAGSPQTSVTPSAD